ncbi:MAG TPA: CopD family protein [Gemmatimonadales bacterium]|nr:CopD family protein [Gemmatimonadales bacterium]
MDEPLVDAAALARWIGYAALFAVVGACTFRQLVSRAVPDDFLRQALARRSAIIGTVAALLLAGALFLRLYLQLREFSDPGAPFSFEMAGPIISTTVWGSGWRWQMAGAIAAIAGLAAAARWRSAWLVAGIGAAVSIFAAVRTGHAIEHPWGALGTALQFLHLGAGAIWLGTLLLLVMVAYPATRNRAEEREWLLASLVHAYSPMALVAGIVTIALGLLLGWNYVGGFGPLFSSTYGRALLVKVALLLGVAAAGAWNWRRVRPALGAPPGSARLRRSATAELVLGTLLLAVTAVLVALPAPEL